MKINKIIIIAVIIAMFFFMAMNVYFFYKDEYRNNQLIREKIDVFDADFLYDYYIASTPSIENRHYYGSEDAGITMIGFIALNSDASRHFIKNIFPRLKEDYIDKGELRFYHKHHITPEDFAEKNDNFKYSAILRCAEMLNKGVYYSFYFDIFETDKIDNINLLLQKRNISKMRIDKCMEENKFRNIFQDALEVDNFGISGINPRFYIGVNGTGNVVLDGVPDYDDFITAIRSHQTILGGLI